MATTDEYSFDQISPCGLFHLLTDKDIGCYTCIFADFSLNQTGLVFKCHNPRRIEQGSDYCYNAGDPKLFDERQKSPETGLFLSQCERCGEDIEAPSMIQLCQFCYEYKNMENIEQTE